MTTTTTYPHPGLAQAPDAVIRPGNGPALLKWCDAHDVTPPTLLHLDAERRRRGLTRKKAARV